MPEQYVYHTIAHTRDVVDTAGQLCELEGITAEQEEIVLLSCWFHDVGYAKTYDRHEEESVRLAREYLATHEYDHQMIERISDCIMSTKVPQHPVTVEARIVCDADLSHLGKKGFIARSKLLKQEIEYIHNEILDEASWYARTLSFLENHVFHTASARKLFDKRKQKNRQKVKELLNDIPKPAKPETQSPQQTEKELKKSLKEKIPERGIETMFRVTSRNHMELSAIADNKANLMISVNAIIISVVVSIFLRSFDEFPQFIIPTIILVVVCVATIIFATLSTRPKVTSGRFTAEDIHNKQANLLFFGNFHRMNLSDFEWGMNEMMNDREYLYGSMIKDIYFLGKVLGMKYRYLRISYTVFMYGLIFAVCSYISVIIMSS